MTSQAKSHDLEADAAALLVGGEDATQHTAVTHVVQESSRGKRLGFSAAALVSLAVVAFFVVLSKDARIRSATEVPSASQTVELAALDKPDARSLARSKEDLSQKKSECKPINPSTADSGYPDEFRGWFDVQGCGTCNDYCRWVGTAGSGGNPTEQLEFNKGSNQSYWSCRLAGDKHAQSDPGHFTSWAFRRCVGKGKPASLTELPKAEANCKPINPSGADSGYPDQYRGWFDVQGCGYCNDYCRWIGNAGSGGDPADQLEVNKGVNHSFWSCRLAGEKAEQSEPGHFTSWAFRRCVGKGESAALKHVTKETAHCKPVNPSSADSGFADAYRGWFDVQGCGFCNDYCRWVGSAGSGGNPEEQLEFKKGVNQSFWSCRLAGDHAAQSQPGHFTNWGFPRCVGKGMASPSEGECQDVPGWSDQDGNPCEWYSQNTRCADYGLGYPNNGYTASTACCVCGGRQAATTGRPASATMLHSSVQTAPVSSSGRVANTGPPAVGDAVRVIDSGRTGVLAEDDGSGQPYRVDFDTGAFHWFAKDQIEKA